MSVTEDSEPGEAAGLRLKKDVNLPPGVVGFFASSTVNEFVDEVEFVRKGGILACGSRPIASSLVAPSTD